MSILVSLFIRLLDLYDLLLLIYVIVSWLRPAENRWTLLLRNLVEPVLNPIRAFLAKHLPQRAMVLDWSPVAAWVLIRVVQMVLGILL